MMVGQEEYCFLKYVRFLSLSLSLSCVCMCVCLSVCGLPTQEGANKSANPWTLSSSNHSCLCGSVFVPMRQTRQRAHTGGQSSPLITHVRRHSFTWTGKSIKCVFFMTEMLTGAFSVWPWLCLQWPVESEGSAQHPFIQLTKYWLW